jgi:hypothetical protein
MKIKLFDTKNDLCFLAIAVGALFCLGYMIVNPIFSNYPAAIFTDDEYVNEDSLKNNVRYLSGLMPPRAFDKSTLPQSAEYIKTIFQPLCEETTSQTHEVEHKTYENIICSFGIKNIKRIVVGAHYDVIGITPGADDNASGVAAILELARIISLHKEKLKNRVDLVAYTLEEPPYFRTENMGSFKHAEMLRQQGADVKLMVALEMLGFYSDAPKSQKFPHWIFSSLYPDVGNFILLVGKSGEGGEMREFKKHILEGTDIAVWSMNGWEKLFGIDFSDHRSYWAFNYPAIMVTDTAFYRNPNYHEPSDTYDTLDYKKMASVVQGVYYAIVNLK